MTSFIFTRIIDPLTKGLRRLTAEKCGADHYIIDLGCGPGTLVFELAEKNHVVGFDISTEVIEFANRKAKRLNLEGNTSFLCEDIDNLGHFKENEFDIVVMSLFLHQFPEEKQLKILSEASRIGKKLIVADYSIPVPNGFNGFAVRLAEAMAGGEHNRSFKSYVKNGGCLALAQKVKLNLRHTQTTSSKAFAVWVFE
jgi:ubiquinone/menaquinone biosynthesis C-methylase UbiE